jgi:membrane protein DedA with SNARE-associated domain
VHGVLAWIESLPTAALYAVLALAAAIENIVPPVPADTVVAFGSFLAARGQGSFAGAFLSTWGGNLVGATLMYYLGRRFGAERIERRLLGAKGPGAEERLKALYGRYGIVALFFSRFLPGVRAVVPPFAGALRIPPHIALSTIAIASGLWYGLIALVAFRIGGSWEEVSATITRNATIAGVIATVIVAIAGGIWWIRRKRRANG